MTREELTKVKNALLALLESLAHYTNWYSARDYWETNEEYEKFNQDMLDTLNIIKKELNSEKENK